MTKNEIIEKYWPKPSQSESVIAWREAAGRMMDDWAVGQSVLFLEYHRRFRIEESVKFKKACEEIGGIFSLADIGAKKIFEKFMKGESIKSESMPGVEYVPPYMTPTIDGKPL